MHFISTNIADDVENSLIQLTHIPNETTEDVVENGKLRALESELFNGINAKCLTYYAYSYDMIYFVHPAY